MDGLETCRQIRAMPGTEMLPIIFLTADERPETHADAFRAKGDDFLRKPVFPTELIVRIRSLMRLKRLQAEIQAERDALIDAQKQREQLFEFIVHDLKNPLATIQVGLDLLSDCPDNSATQKQQLLRIRETAQRMGRMVQNILDISRAEQMGLEVKRSPLVLSEWLPEMFRAVEYRAQRLNQEMSWSCSDGLALTADPDLLGRVLLNLLDNALKYSSSGSHTRLEAEATDTGVRFRVLDEGQGIPEHMRTAIFDKFIRLEEEGAKTRSSSGLGLTFCQVVVEAHGGRIWVEGNDPRGSVFIMEIPHFCEPEVPVFAEDPLR
jgi:two-component system, sensor histidine kinase and response regulator